IDVRRRDRDRDLGHAPRGGDRPLHDGERVGGKSRGGDGPPLQDVQGRQKPLPLRRHGRNLREETEAGARTHPGPTSPKGSSPFERRAGKPVRIRAGVSNRSSTLSGAFTVPVGDGRCSTPPEGGTSELSCGSGFS